MYDYFCLVLGRGIGRRPGKSIVAEVTVGVAGTSHLNGEVKVAIHVLHVPFVNSANFSGGSETNGFAFKSDTATQEKSAENYSVRLLRLPGAISGVLCASLSTVLGTKIKR